MGRHAPILPRRQTRRRQQPAQCPTGPTPQHLSPPKTPLSPPGGNGAVADEARDGVVKQAGLLRPAHLLAAQRGDQRVGGVHAALRGRRVLLQRLGGAAARRRNWFGHSREKVRRAWHPGRPAGQDEVPTSAAARACPARPCRPRVLSPPSPAPAHPLPHLLLRHGGVKLRLHLVQPALHHRQLLLHHLPLPGGHPQLRLGLAQLLDLGLHHLGGGGGGGGQSQEAWDRR